MEVFGNNSGSRCTISEISDEKSDLLIPDANNGSSGCKWPLSNEKLSGWTWSNTNDGGPKRDMP